MVVKPMHFPISDSEFGLKSAVMSGIIIAIFLMVAILYLDQCLVLVQALHPFGTGPAQLNPGKGRAVGILVGDFPFACLCTNTFSVQSGSGN